MERQNDKSLSFVYKGTSPVVPKLYILDALEPHDTASLYHDPSADSAEIWPTLDVKTSSPLTQSVDDETRPEMKVDSDAQEEIDYFAKYINVSIEALGTFKHAWEIYSFGSLTLHNTGDITMSSIRWQVFAHLMRLVGVGQSVNLEDIDSIRCGLKVTHLEGYLFRFEPVDYAKVTLQAGKLLRCRLVFYSPLIPRTDFFPNWYVTSENTQPRIIANTNDENSNFVKIFSSKQLHKMGIASNETKHMEFWNFTHTGPNKRRYMNIIPTPLVLEIHSDVTMSMDLGQWRISGPAEFSKEIKIFAQKHSINIRDSDEMRRCIKVLNKPVDVKHDKVLMSKNEAYSITTQPDKECIIISSSTKAGVFYAFQTLSSLLNSGRGTTLPHLSLTDAPRYPYRGLLLDLSRNFIETKEVLKLIEVMSMYKLNKLHLHLTDNEGWRLEIPGLPELTKLGSRRCHDLTEEHCLLPSLGSGPHTNNSGTGFYSVAEYKQILLHAQQHHVQVIPEIDMPGHSRALIRSLHSKRQRSLRKAMKAEMYSVVDDSEYVNRGYQAKSQLLSNDAVDPCMDTTYILVDKIIRELINLHKDIQPLTMYHLGGDEVPQEVWWTSKYCKDFREHREDINNNFDLMKYFINKTSSMLGERGLAVGIWEDGVIPATKYQTGIPLPRHTIGNRNVYVYVWKDHAFYMTPHRVKLFANDNYKVVLAYGSYLYFDHAYASDPEERGLYWATKEVPTRRVWSFTQSVIFSDNHLQCPKDVINQTHCYKLLKPHNIVGIQADLWTDMTRNNDQIEYMLFPRLLAAAERAWHKASWEDMSDTEPTAQIMRETDWRRFAEIVGMHELPRLEDFNINFRVSPPEFRVQDGKLQFTSEFPNLIVEYFSSQENMWLPAIQGMSVKDTLRLRTRTASGRRRSREIIVEPH